VGDQGIRKFIFVQMSKVLSLGFLVQIKQVTLLALKENNHKYYQISYWCEKEDGSRNFLD